MKKLNIMQITAVSMMLFAIFFGAGNMIFPPAMGQLAGEHFVSALVGFIITDVGIAVLGIMAVVMAGTSIDDLGALINRRFALFFSVSVYLLIGPFFGMPRTANVSFEIAVLPYIDPDIKRIVLFIFSALFFTITYYLSSNPNHLVNVVGKVLTPFLLISILIIFVASLVHSTGNGSIAFGKMMKPSGVYESIPLFQGMVEGYNALDGPAGLAFSVIVINAIQNYGIKDKKSIAKYTAFCGLGAAVLLSVVYFMLSYVGAITNDTFKNGGALLHAVTDHLLGEAGGIVLGGAVVLACFSTAIGLASSFANYFSSILPEKWTYKRIVAAVCMFGFVIANVGLDQLIAISLPILVMIYPVTIVLIVLSFFKKRIGNRRMTYVLGMLFTFVISFINGLEKAEVNLGVIGKFVSRLPLNDLGFGWIWFALAGALIGLLPIWSLNRVNEKKESVNPSI